MNAKLKRLINQWPATTVMLMFALLTPMYVTLVGYIFGGLLGIDMFERWQILSIHQLAVVSLGMGYILLVGFIADLVGWAVRFFKKTTRS